MELIILNHDASAVAMQGWADYLESTQGITLTYPMVFDESGETFETYKATELILPSIFLIDQTGFIHIRADGADEPSEFLPELEEILHTIDDLIANPPGGF